ncbi:MAG: family 10 glycosylhydrolase [Planctomycetota bacterium]
MLLLASVFSNTATAETREPSRGFWLASVQSGALFSPEGVKEAVALAKRSGMNTIYVVTWNRGYTLYPSDVMLREFGKAIDPRLEGRDPLAELITEAHQHGIRVVAWFEFGFASSYNETDGGHILRTRPEWAARDREGRIAAKNNFQWMNAFDPAVQEFVLSLVLEVIAKYDVDGIQGDDRLPANPSNAGYDPLTVSLYSAEHDGADPPADHLDPDWIDWRSQRLNRFAERIYQEVKSADAAVTVSMAPSVYPWSKENYLQDWPTWVKNGWVDEVCPQVYRETIDAYRTTLAEIFPAQLDEKHKPIVFPGILISLANGYGVSEEYIREAVAANRALGLQGEVFFYSEGVADHPEYFEREYVNQR